MRKTVLVVSAILAACGGNSGSAPTTPMASSGQALREFMQAARDSNLTRMSQLWGSSRGPAAETRYPENYERRLVVIQLYLRADSTKVVSDVPVTGEENQRRLIAAIYRSGGCMKQIPALLTRIKGAWVVTDIEVAAAGNPARPCENATPPEGNLTR
jgi:hypothetical protein